MVDPIIDDDIKDLMGGKVSQLEIDSDELNVEIGLRHIRAEILDAIEADGLGVNQLSRVLRVSPSTVSRTIHGEGDMKVSTMLLYGHAIGCEWSIELKKPSRVEKANYFDLSAQPNQNGFECQGTTTPFSVQVISPPVKSATVMNYEPVPPRGE